MTERNLNEIVAARRIIDGPSDKLRAVSAVKYPWTRDLWAAMMANNWTPEMVPLTRDKQQFPLLKYSQKIAIKRALAFLSNLDSIQVDNLALNIGQIITDPNIRECLYRQQFEEVIHVKAYSSMVESLFDDPMDIYDMYNQVPMLKAKNDFIINTSNEVSETPTPINKVKALVSNVALEGIYFFSGFMLIYAVGRDTGHMQGCVDQIKYIQRDELTHLALFTKTYQELRKEHPELWTAQSKRMFQQVLLDACELETKWGQYVIAEGVPGLSADLVAQFIQYITEQRAQSLGLGGLFPGVRNPFSWFDQYSAVNGSHKNFFESKPQTYSEERPVFHARRRTTQKPPLMDSTGPAI